MLAPTLVKLTDKVDAGEQARKLLTMSSMPIARIAQESGFSSQSHLTACFRAAHAVTPAKYRTAVAAGAER